MAKKCEECISCLRTAITKYHKLSGLINSNLWPLSSGNPKSSCQQGWFLLRVLRENLSHDPLLALEAPGIPWHVDGILSISQYHLPSIGICLCVKIPPFYKDTSYFGLGPTLINLTELPSSQSYF